MGLEKKDAYNFNGLEITDTYHVIRKTVVDKKRRKILVDVYANYEAYENNNMPLKTDMIVEDVDDDDDAVIADSYSKMKNNSKYSEVKEKKSDKEKSENEKKNGKK